MPLFKVLNDEGVTIDGVEFPKDEVFELDAEAFNVPELLAEGSIEETEELLKEDENVAVESEDDGELPDRLQAHTDVN